MPLAFIPKTPHHNSFHLKFEDLYLAFILLLLLGAFTSYLFRRRRMKQEQNQKGFPVITKPAERSAVEHSLFDS